MIRKASKADLDQIEQGYQEHFAHERAHGAFTVFQEGIYPTRADAEHALQRDSLYVYEADGTIAGSMILDQVQPDEYAQIDGFRNLSADRVMVLHLLMVRPAMSGKGIAAQLVAHAITLAKSKQCRALRLDTGTQNIPAVSLYQKMGFEIKAHAPMQVGGAIAHKSHLFFRAPPLPMIPTNLNPSYQPHRIDVKNNL